MGKRIAILTFAGNAIGYGHVKRCQRIATILAARGNDVRFILARQKEDEEAAIIVARTGPVTFCNDREEELAVAIKRLSPDILIVDMQNRNLKFLQGNGIPIATLDNFLPGADLYINIQQKNFEKGDAKELNGLQYWAADKPEKVQEEVKEFVEGVLISCGYTDPEGLTPHILKRVLKAHEEKGEQPPTITCIITNSFPKNIEIELKEIYPETRIIKDCKDMGEELRKTDIAISQGGSTTIEALLRRTPTIIIPLGENNEELAQELAKKGLTVNAGKAENVKGTSPSSFEVAYAQLQDKEQRAKLNMRCAEFDAAGATRIADALIALGVD